MDSGALFGSLKLKPPRKGLPCLKRLKRHPPFFPLLSLAAFGFRLLSIGVFLGCFGRKLDGESWFTWWFNHLPGPTGVASLGPFSPFFGWEEAPLLK